MHSRKSVMMVGLLLSIVLTAAEGQTEPAQCQPCSDSEQHVQCEGKCPQYYQVSESDPGVCLQQTAGTTVAVVTTTATMNGTVTVWDANSTMGNASEGESTLTTAPATTPAGLASTQGVHFSTSLQPSNNTIASSNNSLEFSDITTATATSSSDNYPPPPPKQPVQCRLCLKDCFTCNGTQPDHCVKCRKDYELETSDGTKKCVAKRKGVDIVIIAAASAAGGVVLVLVVVVACVCVCRRRRRRRLRKEQERGPGMVGLRDILSTQQAEEENAGKDVDESEMRHPRPAGMELPEYVNVTSTMPRPISIERGHDKVTRYVRDPTVKKSEPPLPRDEDQELEELPDAPLPPRPRKTQTGSELHTAHHPTRSHTVLPTEPNKHDRWRRTGHPAAVSMPEPSTTASSPLPKFPIEEEMERERAEERAARERGPRKPAEGGDLDEPEKDYQNVSAVGKLAEADDRMQSLGGITNPGLDVGVEEPEDDYVNQAAIAEVINVDDEHPYQNFSVRKGY